MKKICTLLILALGFSLISLPAFSQDYTRNGKQFVAVQKSSESTDTKSGFTYKDPKGRTYDIYISKSGACYIYRTSSKTGKTYKSYLDKKISAEICKELGIEYKSNTK